MKTTSSRYLTILLGTFAFVSANESVTLAQGSVFDRQHKSLSAEYKRLERQRIELKIRLDAIKNRRQQLIKSYDRIAEMPSGIARSAAIKEFIRNTNSYRRNRDNLNIEIRKYGDSKEDHTRHRTEFNRRVRAYNQRNTSRTSRPRMSKAALQRAIERSLNRRNGF